MDAWHGLPATVLAATVAGRRRARQRRLRAYRSFGEEHGWHVVGMHQDLSLQYPVAPLVGAQSAQAELALTGSWQDRWGVVASVLVKAGGRISGPQRDTVVQLTVLHTAPPPWEFSAVWHATGPEVAPVSALGHRSQDSIADLLLRAGAVGRLCQGDRIASTGAGLLHARVLAVGIRPPDLEGPLNALVELATVAD